MKLRAPETLFFLAPLLAAGFFVSCGGGSDSTGPATPTVATVSLSETAVTLEVGFTKQLAATLKTASDSILTGIPVAWQSDNPAVASVSSGVIEALAVGTAKITATAGGKTASATVTTIPTVVASISLSRLKATLAPDKTLQLAADALDLLGRKIPSRAVTFSTSNASVAEVTSNGLVTTKQAGFASIFAIAGDKQAMLMLNVALPSNVSIVVQGSTPGSLLKLSSYSLKMRHPDDSLSVSAAINATAKISGAMVLADSVEFLASSVDGSTFTSRSVAASTQLPENLSVVFIPLRVTIPAGTFAGLSVSINLASATDPCLVNSNQCLNGFYGNAFSTGVKRWPSFPIPVSMDPALDTASVWASLRAMEASAGQKLFVLNDTSTNRINVKLGLPPGITGFSGYTQWTWDAKDRMTFATVSFVAANPSRGLVQHEFLHALGFWHTCAWSSVMGGYGCPMALELSSSDVAYLVLANAVYDTESGFRNSNGQLPCGLMSLWAVIPNQSLKVQCFADNLFLQNSVIRQESAP